MFEKLIEIVLHGWNLISPFVVVFPYEDGVILRLGRFNRSVGPGFHWKYPMVEVDKIATTALTTLKLDPQTLTTKDRKSITVRAIVKYQIRDAKTYLLEIWDAPDVLTDVAMGSIKQLVQGMAFEDLLAPNAEAPVLEQVRKEVNAYGFKVHRVTFIDLGQIRSYHFISSPQPHIQH